MSETWWGSAACLGLDPNIFQAVNDSPEELQAKKICASCPVSDNCLEFALANGEVGIWGGLSERERRVVARRRRFAVL